METRSLLFVALCLISYLPLQSQKIIDGFFNKQGSLSLTAGYTNTHYDSFYVGTMKVNQVPVGDVDQDIFSLYGKFAITDDFMVIASAPYITEKAGGNPDPINGETKLSDFQDIQIALKYRLHRFQIDDNNTFDALAAAGVTIPSGYEPNGILSLGTGSVNEDFSLGAQYNNASGFFLSAIAGYSFRGKADDNFDILISRKEFNVPNAVLFNGRLGYAGSHFYLEAFADVQSSVKGVDIMGPGFDNNFPETEVDYTVLGLSAYVPLGNSLGLSGSYGTTTSGRNIGDTDYFNVGLTYNLSTGGGSSSAASGSPSSN